MNTITRTPAHLWIVGIIATVWNAIGCYDYLMTRMRNTEYLQSMMPGVDPNAMLAWVDSFPIWAQFGWGLGVWGGLLGSILLLLRSRYAFHALAASFVGMILGLGYQIALAPPPPGVPEEGMMAMMPYVIILIGAVLLYYAWRMRNNGVLR